MICFFIFVYTHQIEIREGFVYNFYRKFIVIISGVVIMSQQPPQAITPRSSTIFRMMNGMMGLVLRSPFHRGMSKQLGLITVTGRKSHKRYTTPIGYVRVGDKHVHVFTHAPAWWKNLRGGGPVTIRMEGKDYQGTGITIEDHAAIVEHFYNYLSQIPNAGRPFGVRFEDGKPVREDVVAQAQANIMIDITLN
jgi:hypothetical protein